MHPSPAREAKATAPVVVLARNKKQWALDLLTMDARARARFVSLSSLPFHFRSQNGKAMMPTSPRERDGEWNTSLIFPLTGGGAFSYLKANTPIGLPSFCEQKIYSMRDRPRFESKS